MLIRDVEMFIEHCENKGLATKTIGSYEQTLRLLMLYLDEQGITQTELKEQIQAEKDRSKEIKELDKYVGTDKYVEDVAKEKLGLVHNNEIIFKAK